MGKCPVKLALENVIRQLREEKFMKEEFEPEPDSSDGWDWHTYQQEKDGKREARNKIAREAWDRETEEIIRSCYEQC